MALGALNPEKRDRKKVTFGLIRVVEFSGFNRTHYSGLEVSIFYAQRGDEVSFSEIGVRGDLSGMGQQAIVNQAAFDIGQMTEQKLRQRSRLKACAGTQYLQDKAK